MRKIYIVIFIIFLNISAFASDDKNIFSTWEGLEVDKCASIWLIKRFINTEAKIIFFPKGTQINRGIPFDTPDASLRRYHNISTFVSILKQYNIKDSALIHMGKIINDIEINKWHQKKFIKTPEVQKTINRIISETHSNKETLEKCFDYFDSLFIKSKTSRNL